MTRRSPSTQARQRRHARLWFVCQWFAPEPVGVPSNIARSLARSPMPLTVITGVPNYPTGIVAPGYSAARFSRETIDGVVVERCPLYPSHDRSALGRFVNYASWALSSTFRALTRVRRRDVVLVYSSPATAALPAIVCRVFFGTPFILMVQDLWPDSVLATGFVKHGAVRRLAHSSITWFVQRAYSLASHVVVISPGMIDLLGGRGVPTDKLSLIYNWADEDVFVPAEPDGALRPRLKIADDTFVVMYAGNIGPAQALDDVIRAVALVDGATDIALVLVGQGVEAPVLQELAAKVAPGRVHFVGQIPSDQMAATMAAADVQLIALRDDEVFAHAMPSKVQSIFACGLPVISFCPGDVRGVVTESGAGWSAAPGNVEELAQRLGEAARAGAPELARRGSMARDYYERTMSREVNARRLVDLLHTAATRRDGRRPERLPARRS